MPLVCAVAVSGNARTSAKPAVILAANRIIRRPPISKSDKNVREGFASGPAANQTEKDEVAHREAPETRKNGRLDRGLTERGGRAGRTTLTYGQLLTPVMTSAGAGSGSRHPICAFQGKPDVSIARRHRLAVDLQHVRYALTELHDAYPRR